MTDQGILTKKGQPISPYRAMRDMMEDMMEEFFSDWPSMKIRPFEWRMQQFTPFIDVIDEDKQIRVEVETPGMGTEDLELTITEDSLILRGEKKQEEGEHGNRYRERSFGSFQRIIPLPCDIDRDNVRASFRNGVLHIVMPKSQRAIEQSRRIEIESETATQQSGQGLSKQDEEILEGAGLA